MMVRVLVALMLCAAPLACSGGEHAPLAGDGHTSGSGGVSGRSGLGGSSSAAGGDSVTYGGSEGGTATGGGASAGDGSGGLLDPIGEGGASFGGSPDAGGTSAGGSGEGGLSSGGTVTAAGGDFDGYGGHATSSRGGTSFGGQPACEKNTCDTPTPGLYRCGDSSDNCGGTLHCPATCPEGGSCGVPGGPAWLCSCYFSDDPRYPCRLTGGRDFVCFDSGVDHQPTIPGCVSNPEDEFGNHWCCP